MYDKEKTIKALKELLEDLENGSFAGVLLFTSRDGLLRGELDAGFVEPKIEAIDIIFRSACQGPKEEFKFFMEEMFKRWIRFFGRAYEIIIRSKRAQYEV
jgi:hypothetical protein